MTDTVDCDGCAAPCCRRMVFSCHHDPAAPHPIDDHRIRNTWMAAGAILRPIPPHDPGHDYTVFACAALTPDARCGVYADRPVICRIYDCREDAARMESDDVVDRPHCVIP